MRQIKFRVWDIESEKMIYGVGLTPANDGFTPYKIPSTLADSDQFNYYPNSILMQFTGLCDRNGKEIYEGDIVILTKEYEQYVTQGNGYLDTGIEKGWSLKGEVKFLYNCWFIDEGEGKGCPLDFEGEKSLEIQGNIYWKGD